ncbi:maleylpyruvate isomerase N-terminal domain-containing protein [Naasia lichenicola]|uniref:maleylpyruvate isomerase N-terminal domain-containing protein n=1 Tax=Naasia lichenicola TaxID=2565933 RepID=UPI00130E7DA3|nr:maleylpyruvate isomerase N-terminal domain-containing protein [Naasia lichenicola]
MSTIDMSELARVSDAFATEAGQTDPSAPIASRIWPTAGEIVDHLGNIQRWATAAVQTRGSVDVREHARPSGRDPIEWFTEGASALTEELERADPDAECWTFVGPGRNAFWQRRMVHEATKHLWDLRTAKAVDPPMPAEVDAGTPAAIIDEFDEVFIARARRQGIAHLPGSVLLRATDSNRSWLIEPDWIVLSDGVGRADAVLEASAGDLALVLWERADPWALGSRFSRSGDEAVLRALTEARVHR